MIEQVLAQAQISANFSDERRQIDEFTPLKTFSSNVCNTCESGSTAAKNQDPDMRRNKATPAVKPRLNQP